MGGVLRAIISPLSIIDKDLGRISLQIVAIGANFIPGGQPFAAAASLALATLYKPKGPKPEQQERSIRISVPPRISAYGRVRLFGAYILFDTAEDGYAVDAWAYHDGQIDGIERYYLADKQVTLNGGSYVIKDADGAYGDGDTILIGTRLGLPTETAFSELIAKVPSIWTANHRGDGVVTGFMISKAVKQKNYSEVYPNGGPDQSPLSLVVRAQRVFDWRDPAQDVEDPDTWTWSENNALQVAHYYLVRVGKDWDTHFAPTLAYWTAFADDCDVAMPLKAGGTEPRYRSCLAHKHTDQHKVTLGNLLACSDGWVAPRSDGALLAFSGRYIEPDPDDLIGPGEILSFSWDDGIVDEDAINEIDLSYISSEHDYSVVDATAWRDEDSISAVGEKATPLENSVPSHAQARRLAKRLLSKTMAPYRGSVTTNWKGRKIRGKRFIPLHIEEAGAVFFSGVAEITRLTRNLQTGGVTFTWISADPNVDAWNPATEEGDPAPVGNRIAPAPLDTPTIDTATPVLSSDYTSAQILIDITAPDRDDLTWFARWKVSADAIWNEQAYSDIDPGAAVTLLTGLVPLEASIDVAVAYQVGDGRVSDWSTTETVSTSTATLAPGPVTDFAVIGSAGQADGSWQNPTSPNLVSDRLYRNTTNSFGTATQIGGDIPAGLGAPGSFSNTGLAAGTYYFFVTTVSSGGTEGTPVASGAVTVT